MVICPAVVIEIARLPWALVPHIMDNGRVSLSPPEDILSHSLIGGRLVYQIFIVKISIIGEKVIPGRQWFDPSLKDAIDGVLVAVLQIHSVR